MEFELRSRAGQSALFPDPSWALILTNVVTTASVRVERDLCRSEHRIYHAESTLIGDAFRQMIVAERYLQVSPFGARIWDREENQ